MDEQIKGQLDAVREANKVAREGNQQMLEGNLAASAVIVSQQAAALAQGVLSRPDFFGGNK